MITIEKSQYVTQVYIDGMDMGTSVACYTPIEFPVNNAIKFGAENEILIGSVNESGSLLRRREELTRKKNIICQLFGMIFISHLQAIYVLTGCLFFFQ